MRRLEPEILEQHAAILSRLLADEVPHLFLYRKIPYKSTINPQRKSKLGVIKREDRV